MVEQSPATEENAVAPAESGASRKAWHAGLAWVKAGVSVGLLWVLFTNYDFGSAKDRLLSIDIGWLGLAFCGYAISVGFITWRWCAILRPLGVDLALKPALGIIMIGLFFNQTLPSNLGGEAMKVWRLFRRGSRLGRAVGSVMLDRVIASVSLALLVLMTLPMAARLIDDAAIVVGLAILTAVVLSGLVFLLVLERATSAITRLLPQRLRDAVILLARDARTVLLAPRIAAATIVVSIANHLVAVLTFMALARGLGIDAEFATFVVLIPPVVLAALVPLSFAGWGVREGAMVAMLGAVGIPAGEALALSVGFGLLALAAALPGGLVWLVTGNRATAGNDA
jgi:uncharacterized protein (TIRG00374 family)